MDRSRQTYRQTDTSILRQRHKTHGDGRRGTNRETGTPRLTDKKHEKQH